MLIGALTEEILGVPVPVVTGVLAGDERTNIAGSVSSASRVEFTSKGMPNRVEGGGCDEGECGITGDLGGAVMLISENVGDPVSYPPP